LATALEAEEKRREQQRLILEGSRYCLALSLFFATALIFLGRPFLRVWVGPELENAWLLLAILTLGELLPMGQWITYSVLLGMGRHRALAHLSILENLLAIPLAILLAKPFGLVGVCIGFTVPGALCRGVLQLLYACRVARLSIVHYLVAALVPPLVLAVPCAALLAIVVRWRPPANWFELIIYGAAYAIAFAVSSLLLLVDRSVPTPLAGVERWFVSRTHRLLSVFAPVPLAGIERRFGHQSLHEPRSTPTSEAEAERLSEQPTAHEPRTTPVSGVG
jgi:O-antigen/teichoic acid export membrane protein